MKHCSQCGRTYEEDLTFCLVDGSVLSAPYDPKTTLRNQARQTTEPPPTEVLPHQPTIQPAPKRNQPLFLYAALGIAVLVVGIVAVVGVVWTLTSSNTRNVAIDSAPSSGTPVSSSTPTPRAIDISGSWRDAYGNTSQITQAGETFSFSGQGTACRGNYVTSGTGKIEENRVEITYESNYSQGQCQGTTSQSGSRMTLTCVDSACGQFLSVSERTAR